MSRSLSSRGLHPKTRVSSIFIDESGSKNSSGGFFVVGFIKSRQSAELRREMHDLRQRHGHFKEAKFGAISRKNLPFFFDVAELIGRSEARVGGSVYDSCEHFQDDEATWKVQARMSSLLVLGNLNKNEVVNVLLDVVETPRGESVAKRVQDSVNGALGQRAVVAAYDLDSQCTDLLQLADFVAGAIAYERRREAGFDAPSAESPKAQASARLRRALGLDSFADVRDSRVNILTMMSQPKALPGLEF